MSKAGDKDRIEIEVTDNGPLHITGNFEFTDPRREISEKKSDIFLCRCFRSSNLPYCDGTHKRPENK